MIIAEAIKYMDDNITRTVLIDIFPRELSSKNKTVIGGINVNNLGTHTVLLYKTTTNQILAIDPNNPMFSSHLSKYRDDVNGQLIQTLCSTDSKHKIYSRPEKSETGFDIAKFRDCTDSVPCAQRILHDSINVRELCA